MSFGRARSLMAMIPPSSFQLFDPQAAALAWPRPLPAATLPARDAPCPGGRRRPARRRALALLPWLRPTS
jgi:hypothetical protein